MAVEHIEDLRVFVQIVDTGTLAAAGRVLGLPATLVSRRLARLEESLAVRLIERTTRRLHITEEGWTFYARCRRVLAELESAELELTAESSAVSGTVRTVLPTSMLAYGVMDALKAFMDEHPQLTIEVQLSDRPVDLLAGGWDVATHIGIPTDSSHISRRLGTLSPRLAATPEYLARHGVPKDPMDLATHECIRQMVGGVPVKEWPIVNAVGELQRVPVSGRLICYDIISLYTAMCSGHGIGLVPMAALRKARQEGLLVEVLADCYADGPTLFALIPAGRNKMQRVRLFTEWLASFMETLNS